MASNHHHRPLPRRGPFGVRRSPSACPPHAMGPGGGARHRCAPQPVPETGRAPVTGAGWWPSVGARGGPRHRRTAVPLTARSPGSRPTPGRTRALRCSGRRVVGDPASCAVGRLAPPGRRPATRTRQRRGRADRGRTAEHGSSAQTPCRPAEPDLGHGVLLWST
jgi:hypothetical protein